MIFVQTILVFRNIHRENRFSDTPIGGKKYGLRIGGYGYGGGFYGGSTFVLIVVLFILLIIVLSSMVY
jgi:uncharacterized protein (TIGR01732 family)